MYHNYLPTKTVKHLNEKPILPRQGLHISAFTRILLKKTGMNATQEELDWDISIKSLILLSFVFFSTYIAYTFM